MKKKKKKKNDTVHNIIHDVIIQFMVLSMM